MEEQEFVVSIDFEAAGGNFVQNAFLCLGSTLTEVATGKEIACFLEWANMNGYKWDPACIARFWEKCPELYFEALRRSTTSPYSPQEVVKLWVIWVKRNTENKPNTLLISDNVAFDIGLLRSYSEEDDIAYLFKSKSGLPIYRDIVDVTSYYYGLNRCLGVCNTFDNLSSRDEACKAVEMPNHMPTDTHNALEDARFIAKFWCMIQNALYAINNS